jgi:formylglycine-generating enzyme required for sulfatase activity
LGCAGPQKRQRQVGLRWAAETLAEEFVSTKEKTALEQAESFLREEMVDSGIIVERGHRLEFWHLSFQEYLAAFEIAGLLEKDQIQLLFKGGRIYSSEWREPALLLGGVLYKQGDEKINHLIDEIIKQGPKKKGKDNLPQLAQEVGLLGSIVHDLTPFNFSPSNPEYHHIVQSVMGIFDKETYRDIPVQVRIEAADALGRAGDPRLQDNPMVTIAGGRFRMGAQKGNPKERSYDPEADEAEWNEAPVHHVELSPFLISKYPVTVGQYLKFMEDGGYDDERYWRAGKFGEFKGPDNWEDQKQFPSRPVVFVNWYEAAAYASWAGGRLPTEAEWERAARGPQQEYRKYPWGNEEPTGETANFSESKIDHVTPVGIFPENCSPEGVIDMAGNVWEWCNDWFNKDYYRTCAEKGIVNNPEGPENGDRRVIRGGSFNVFRDGMRCADRVWYGPLLRSDDLGFRVVRAI